MDLNRPAEEWRDEAAPLAPRCAELPHTLAARLASPCDFRSSPVHLLEQHRLCLELSLKPPTAGKKAATLGSSRPVRASAEDAQQHSCHVHDSWRAPQVADDAPAGNARSKRARSPVADESPLDNLPEELLLLVLSRAAAGSNTPGNFIDMLLTSRRTCRVGSRDEVLRLLSSQALQVSVRHWCPASLRFLSRCSQAGNVPATYSLGMLWFYCLGRQGWGRRLLEQAAAADSPEALFALAVILFNASGGSKMQRDVPGGVAMCTRAAELGHVDAMRELGHCLQDGYGVRRDPFHGRRMLLKASMEESARALAFACSNTASRPGCECRGQRPRAAQAKPRPAAHVHRGCGQGQQSPLHWQRQTCCPSAVASLKRSRSAPTQLLSELADRLLTIGAEGARVPPSAAAQEVQATQRHAPASIPHAGQSGHAQGPAISGAQGGALFGVPSGAHGGGQGPTPLGAGEEGGEQHEPSAARQAQDEVAGMRSLQQQLMRSLGMQGAAPEAPQQNTQGPGPGGVDRGAGGRPVGRVQMPVQSRVVARMRHQLQPTRHQCFCLPEVMLPLKARPDGWVRMFLTEWHVLARHERELASRAFGAEAQEECMPCSNKYCGRVETRSDEFRCCSVCTEARYCSRVCQAQDWTSGHRSVCSHYRWLAQQAFQTDDE